VVEWICFTMYRVVQDFFEIDGSWRLFESGSKETTSLIVWKLRRARPKMDLGSRAL
jgi:hypothetical protein